MNRLEIPPEKLGFDDERARVEFMRSKNEERAKQAWEDYAQAKRKRDRFEKAELIGFWVVMGFLITLCLALVGGFLGWL